MDLALRQKELKLKDLCARYVYPWLIELGEKAKKHNIMPLSLSDFYDNPKEIEVAAILDLALPVCHKDNYVLILKNTLNGNLWEKATTRNFMEFNSTIPIMKKVERFRVFNIFDWIWSVVERDKVSLEDAILAERGIIERRHKELLSNVVSLGDFEYRLDLLIARMTLNGIWATIDKAHLSCPLNSKARNLLRVMYPLTSKIRPLDENYVIEFIGFKQPIDFMYAYLGYERVRALHPTLVNKFEKKLYKWWSDKTHYDLWVNLPDVFDKK